MEKITAQEALYRLTERYKEKVACGERKKPTRLDINDYTGIFQSGSEVAVLECFQEGETMEGTLRWVLYVHQEYSYGYADAPQKAGANSRRTPESEQG